MPRPTAIMHYLLFAVGLLPYYLLPLMAGYFVDRGGFSGFELGLLLSADLIGGTLMALFARFWIQHLPWRPVLLLAVALAAISNLASLMSLEFQPLLISRSLAGLAGGTMTAFVYAGLSQVPDQDRQFSIALAAQVALGAVLLLALPPVQARLGAESMFLVLGLFSLMPLLLLSHLPSHIPVALDEDGVGWSETESEEINREESNGKETRRTGAQRPVPLLINRRQLLGLTAIAFYMLSLTAVWVLVERLAAAEEIPPSTIGQVLSLGMLFSFPGR